MEDKTAYERLLGQGFSAQEIDRLTQLRRDYAQIRELDRPIAQIQQTNAPDRLYQRLLEDTHAAFTQHRLGLLLIVISAISFGVMPIFARFAYAGGADPITVLLLRFVLAAGVMSAIIVVRREPLPRGRALLGLILMGACGYAGLSLAYFTALTMASAGKVALLLYLYPALVTILSVVFFKERLSRVKVGALFLALSGTVLTTGLVGRASAIGLILGIAAAVIYAIYILAGSRVVHQAGSLSSSALVMIGAAAVYAGISAFHGLAFPHTISAWMAVITIALVSTVLAFVTFFAGLKRVGPIAASTVSTCEPVVTVVLAAVVLGERMGLLQLLGGALIVLAAVTLVRGETGQKRPKAPPAATTEGE
jgi:drug/metabolite transporter (DMT)-like permease